MLYALDTTAITGLPAPSPPSGVDQVNLPSFSGADLWSAVKSCLRPSSAITTLGLGACLRPMLGQDPGPSANSFALVGDQDDVPVSIIRMMAPAIVRSPAKKTQVLILPLAPLRPKAWTATFLDPEDAPSDDTDDSVSDSDSDAATNLWSKSSAHSTTTSVGDDLEFAPPNLVVKKSIQASLALTIKSVSLLDIANVHGVVNDKERSIISWISTDGSSLSEAPQAPHIAHSVDTEDTQTAAPDDIIDARSSLVDTRTVQVAETVLKGDNNDGEDDGEDEWDEWDQLMAEVAVDAGISSSDDSVAVLQESTSSRTFATATRATDISAAFDVTSVWEDFEIALKPSSATFVLTVVVPSASENVVGVIDSNVGCSGDLIEVNEEVSKSNDEEAWGRVELAGFSAPIVSLEAPVEESDVCRACKVSVANPSTVTTNTLAALRVSTSYDMLESRLKEAEENKKINTFMHEVALDEDEDEGEVECILSEEDDMISYEEPITELALKVEDEDEEDEYAVEEMLMDDVFAVEDSNTIELPIPGPAMVSPFAGKAGKSCNEESGEDDDDDDRALHHSFDTHSTYAPHQVNKDSYIVATKTNLATRVANTLLYFEYLAILTIFELLSHVCLTTFTLALRVVPSLSTAVVIMRSMVQIIVFLVFVLWCLMLVDPGSPGAQYGGQRGYLVAT